MIGKAGNWSMTCDLKSMIGILGPKTKLDLILIKDDIRNIEFED